MWQQIEHLIQQSQRRIRNLPLESVAVNPERRNYYRFLYRLVKTYKPKLCLEIGIQSGMASAYMCSAGSQVVGIDILTNIMAMPDNFHFIHGDSTNIDTYDEVVRLVVEYGRIGLVFQDSSHHYLPSKREWELYSALLAPNAIWICDDITPAFYNAETDPPGKGMIQYFEELPGEKRLYQDVLHRGNRQGIVLL